MPEMINSELMSDILNSLKDPFVFADTDHIIQYMNKVALTYFERGADLLGTNVLDCHNEESCKMMLEIFAEMQNEGLEEKLITDNEKYRIYMRAVRSKAGELRGYYERYEPPRGS